MQPLRHQPQQGFKALSNALAGSVDRDRIANPSFVVPRHDLFPSNRDIDDACFEAAPMLAPVRTDDLYFKNPYGSAFRGAAPSVACDLQRVDTVSNDRATQAKIVLGKCVGNAIAFVVDGNGRISLGDGPLDSVNAQIDGA